MDDQIETLLGLIPLALIIAGKVFLSSRKKAEAGESKRLTELLSRSIKENQDFDAHRLEPDAEEFEGHPWESTAAAKPLAPESSRLFSAHRYRIEPEAIQAPHLDAKDLPTAPVSPESLPSAGKKAAVPAPVKEGFVLRLEKLSPLKRAVVMAEILGTPRGF